jgi:WD40 repeat protein
MCSTRTPPSKESNSLFLLQDRNSPLSSLVKISGISHLPSTSNRIIRPLVFPYPRTTVSCIRFDENRLIIAESHSLRVFSLAPHSQSSSRPQLAHIRIPGHMPTSVDFTASILVSGGRDSTLRWYDWDTNELLHTSARRVNHTDTVSSLYYQPKGNSIFSCGLDGLVKVWNAQTGLCDFVQ